MATTLPLRSHDISSAGSFSAYSREWQLAKLRRRCLQQRMIGARASSELVEPLTLSSDPGLTWQTTAGAIAGVTPFVIAGVEFSKRIIQQRNCEVCGGSGLVKRFDMLVRCNACGGFLPWQSWRRFFSSRR